MSKDRGISIIGSAHIGMGKSIVEQMATKVEAPVFVTSEPATIISNVYQKNDEIAITVLHNHPSDFKSGKERRRERRKANRKK